MSEHFVTHSAVQTAQCATRIGNLLERGDLVVLCGDLGAGKTVFSKAVGAALDVVESMTSPTFTLIRTYQGRFTVHHLDVYRLSGIEEAADLGLSELLDGDAVTLIEWGDQILAALPPDYLEVRLELGEHDDQRLIHLNAVGPRWAVRLPQVVTAVRSELGQDGGVDADSGN